MALIQSTLTRAAAQSLRLRSKRWSVLFKLAMLSNKKPNVPIFRRIEAKIIEPKTGAST